MEGETINIENIMDDNKSVVVGIAIVAALIAVIAIAISGSITYIAAKAFENGYEQRTLPGSTGSHWVKAEPKKP